MDKVTKALEWAERRLRLHGHPLDEYQLEVLNFAFHELKQGSINTNVVRPVSHVGGGELLQGEALEQSGSGCKHENSKWIWGHIFECLDCHEIYSED